jgi:uncharacterized protein involved in exopolysaccharide biosynthesis
MVMNHQSLRPDLTPKLRPGLGTRQPIRAHAPFLVVFVLSAALTALGLTYVYSERFAAETTTLFEPTEVTRLSAQETRALGSPVPNTPFKVIGQTFAGLIKSDSLLRETVQELNLDVEEPVVFNGPWYRDYYKMTKQFLEDYGSYAWSYLQFGRIVQDDRTTKAIKDLRNNTKVVSEDSYVFTLRTLAKTPETAAKTADDLAIKLIAVINGEDRRSALRRGDELRRLVEGKSEEIARLEARMCDLLESVNAASLDTEIERATNRKSQLQLQLIDAEASLKEEDTRSVGYGRRLLAGQEQSRAVSYADRVQGRIPVLLSQGDDISDHPANGRLSADDFARLTSERLAAENRAIGLRARANALSREVGPLEERLQQLNRVRVDYDLVGAQLQAAKRDLVALSDTLQESVIKASNQQTQLRVQSSAQAPQTPVSPIKIYHVGLATALALALGMGMSVLLSYFEIHLLMVGERWRTAIQINPSLPRDVEGPDAGRRVD